jgi:hypothetical protein
MSAVLWIVGPFLLFAIILLTVDGAPLGIQLFRFRRRWMHMAFVLLVFVGLVLVLAALGV